jgi:hypothetical protein
MPDTVNWDSFGNDYNTVNQNLGGLPDTIRQSGIQPQAPVSPQAPAQPGQKDFSGVNAFLDSHPLLRGITGGLYSAANAVTGGLWGSMGKKVDPNDQSGLSVFQRAAEKSPVASGIGQGAALAGQAIAAPQAAIEGVSPFVNNALTAASITAPNALSEGIDTGKWGDAVKHWAANGLIGGVAGALPEKIPAFLAGLKNKLENLNIGTAGISLPMLKKAFGALPEKEAMEAKTGLSDMIEKGNLRGPDAQRKIIETLSAPFVLARKVFDDSGKKISDIKDDLMAYPQVQEVLSTYGDDAKNAVEKLLDQVSQKTSAFGIRSHFEKIAQAGAQTGNTITNDAAQALRNSFDNYIGNMAGTDMFAARGEYGPARVLRGALKKNLFEPTSLFAANSATAPREALLSRLLGPVITGGATAATEAATGNPPDIGTIGIATLMGELGNRALSRGANAVAGRVAGKLAGRIPEVSPEIANQIGPMAAITGAKLAAGVGGSGGTQSTEVPGMAPEVAQGQTPKAPQPPQTPQMEGSDWVSGASEMQQPGIQALPKAQQQTYQDVGNKENQMEPQAVQEAKDDTLAPFQEAIKDKMFQFWNTWKNPYKAAWPDFYDQAKVLTNNFDPKNENTAVWLAGPNYKDYLRTYQSNLELKSLGPDLAKAMSYHPGLPALFQDKSAKLSYDRLVNTLYTAMTGNTGEAPDEVKKKIENRLYALRFEDASSNTKKGQLMDLLQKEYNVRFDLLKQYGLM